MASEIVNFIFLSEILNLPVVSLHDSVVIGRLHDLTATTTQVFPKITGMIIKRKNREGTEFIPWRRVRNLSSNGSIAVEYSWGGTEEQSEGKDADILLKKTFLDKQIISTSGNKVVRVNDLHLLIDNSSKENSNLWLVHIDIGIRGLLRRLGWEHVINAIVKWIIARDLRDKFVSWKYVQPTATTDVYGSLHLSIDSSKLSEVHPADIADVLEDLGTEERVSLIESLHRPIAAATLQEIPLKMRIQIAETLSVGTLAGLISEMHLDEAVDLLDEISPEQRSGVYSLLTEERVRELKELSHLAMYSVGRLMDTDFIVAEESETVQEVLNRIGEKGRKTELIYYVYVVDRSEHLQGVVTLRHLLSSKPTRSISQVMYRKLISVTIDANIKRVARLFFKYDFIALPVVDDDGKIQGIVTSRDVLESVFPEMKEESDT